MGSGAPPETGASDNPGIRPSRHATLHSHAYFFSLSKPNLEWSRWIRASPFLVYFFFSLFLASLGTMPLPVIRPTFYATGKNRERKKKKKNSVSHCLVTIQGLFLVWMRPSLSVRVVMTTHQRCYRQKSADLDVNYAGLGGILGVWVAYRLHGKSARHEKGTPGRVYAHSQRTTMHTHPGLCAIFGFLA